MKRDAKILITGGRGMVGSALSRYMKGAGWENLLVPASSELNLLDNRGVDAYFRKNSPEYVFMVAAKVGGIKANIAYPVEFLSENLSMELNLFDACHRYGVIKNLFVGSSCVYPRECPQPMKEEYLLTGPFEPTNEGYALSKVVGLRLAEYYEKEYGMKTVCPMVANIYGTGDSFDLDKSHVLSALVKRFVDAVDDGKTAMTLWGTGGARREFIHADDVAIALCFLMERYETTEIINVGHGQDVSIKELANIISELVGYKGEIHWDTAMPDGMPRKCMDTTRLRNLGFSPRISLEQGIKRTIEDYRQKKSKEVLA